MGTVSYIMGGAGWTSASVDCFTLPFRLHPMVDTSTVLRPELKQRQLRPAFRRRQTSQSRRGHVEGGGPAQRDQIPRARVACSQGGRDSDMHDETRHEIETGRAMSIQLGLLIDRDASARPILASQPTAGVPNGSGNWFQFIAWSRAGCDRPQHLAVR